MNERPDIHGMGAFEGFSSGVLLQQRAARLAKLALDGLDDEAFGHVLIEAIRNRPAILLERIIDGATK